MGALNKRNCRNNQSGFTLTELIVSMSILLIITAVIMFRYSDFNSVVLLQSQTYEVALDLREAQTFGLSVRGTGTGFRNPYGVHFDTSSPGSYIFFQDNDNDSSYDSGEELNTLLLDPRFEVSAICVGDMSCSTNVTSVSVTFERPNFDARFDSGVSSSPVYVQLRSVGSQATTSVGIYTTGLITVEE